MCRLLSQILIIILLLLGPVTFTTANIPNFQPDCEAGSYTSARTTVRVAIADRPPRFNPQPCAAQPPQEIITAVIRPPYLDLFFPACYSRPPPHTAPYA
jgi:hypothetical protein